MLFLGVYCEKAKGNCAIPDQPAECGTNLPNSLCIFDTVKSYCPRMCNHPACTCGYDVCLNGGFFNAFDCTCKCPVNYYGTVCENYSACSSILSCQNRGIFNPTTCVCDCLSNNFGGFIFDKDLIQWSAYQFTSISK